LTRYVACGPFLDRASGILRVADGKKYQARRALPSPCSMASGRWPPNGAHIQGCTNQHAQ
jgi:hypothetical protein